MRSDDAFSTIFTIAAYVLGISGFLFFIYRAKHIRAAIERGDDLDAFAQALSGRVVRDPSFDGPVVRFDVNGIPTYCRQWMLFLGRSTVVTTFECRAGFRGFFEATSWRALRYPTKSPRFRVLTQFAGYNLVTTSAAWAETLMDAGLRDILRQLGGWRHRVRLQLTADRFLLEIERRISPAQTAELAQFLGRIAALAGTLELSKGISFLGEVTVAAHGRCPVCCQEFVRPELHCGHCRAPHHADCWAYWGRCAIFGCRGRRTATSASP